MAGVSTAAVGRSRAVFNGPRRGGLPHQARSARDVGNRARTPRGVEGTRALDSSPRAEPRAGRRGALADGSAKGVRGRGIGKAPLARGSTVKGKREPAADEPRECVRFRTFRVRIVMHRNGQRFRGIRLDAETEGREMAENEKMAARSIADQSADGLKNAPCAAAARSGSACSTRRARPAHAAGMCWRICRCPLGIGGAPSAARAMTAT